MKYRSWPILIFVLLGLHAYAEFPPDSFPEDDALLEEAPPTEDPTEPAEDDAYLKPRKRRAPKPAVRPKRARSAPEKEAKPDDSPLHARLSGWAGYGSLSDANTTNDNAIATLYGRDHFLLGANAEVSFARYFGAELEVMTGFTPANETAVNNVVTETNQFKHLAVMGGVRAILPLRQGDTVWTPRLTLGYGLGSVSQNTHVVSGNSTTLYEISISGFFVSAGIDAEFGDLIHLFADYGMTLGGSGGYQASGSSTASSTFTSPGLTRLRVGGSFGLFGHIRVGPMVILRGFNADAPTNVNLHIGKGNQVLQLVGVISAAF
ncbi:porin family protein [bacterium]|nr:porin family protein [bacterium]